MSEIVVFTGPTLTAEEVLGRLPHADVRPPAALGDVYRAVQSRPGAIAMIDGYFERVPSPWHKELLWAINEGVTLFGAASMGALRAAELEPFGMVGVGQVYDWFHSGALEDDDEVAVAHLSADDGFRPVSAAMVNVRATLDRAVDDGAIDQATAATMGALAKSLHYTDRTWSGILGRIRSTGALGDDVLTRFEAWLADGKVDLKAEDARMLLGTVDAWLQGGSTTQPKSWRFEHTTFWERALQEIISDQSDNGAQSSGSDLQRVLDELRLRPDEHREVFDQAFVRWLAGAYAQARSLELGPDETQAVLDGMRSDMQLWEAADVEAWLAEEEMSTAQLRTQVREEAFVAWAKAKARMELDPIAADVLRVRRRYGALLSRARAKHETLGTTWTGDAIHGGDVVSDEELLAWWFEDQLGQPVPADLDAHVHQNRLGDRSSFLQAIRREHGYAAAQQRRSVSPS